MSWSNKKEAYDEGFNDGVWLTLFCVVMIVGVVLLLWKLVML